ncbi:MAG: hypothetical protein FD137_233 [Spirochaetes bacterium]|nr:MAG: hypothetical protein FD137_233 [Spirochaetota bacterium]
METIDTNTTFDSPLFHALARDAVGRCDGKGDFEAITAVIMSCTAFEAFLNELAQFAITEDTQHSDSMIHELAVSQRIAIECKAPTLDRYDYAWEIMHKTQLDKGSGCRQKLTTLFALRNSLVHAKAEKTSIVIDLTAQPPAGLDEAGWLGQIRELYDLPKFVKALQSDGHVNHEPQDERWVTRICDRRVAVWAFDLVAEAAAELIQPSKVDAAFYKRLIELSLAGYETRKSKHA